MDKKLIMLIVLILCCVAICNGDDIIQSSNPTKPNITNALHTGLTERIGNFSIELLYHTARSLENGQNFIMSPITLWSVLALISEGAAGETRKEINKALRLPSRSANTTRADFRNITQWLKVNTGTVKLAKINYIFVDKERLPLQDFWDIAKNYYETEIITVQFSDILSTANLLNSAISNITHGMIPKLVDPNDFSEPQMLLTSALYFKGQWSVPFNQTSTTEMPFYDSSGQQTGKVNMMYNRYTYPFSNIRELQARVIELPYGKEDRLSMLIMLPNPGVTVEDMFANFGTLDLDHFFSELRRSKEEYADDEVDCYIPRFKIESNIDLTSTLREKMGIQRLFDQNNARLPHISRNPMYVTKVVHKAQIEVTEEGTTASAVTTAEFSNRIGVVQFMANRPFSYIIVEKVTNSIVFGGFYKQPSLY